MRDRRHGNAPAGCVDGVNYLLVPRRDMVEADLTQRFCERNGPADQIEHLRSFQMCTLILAEVLQVVNQCHDREARDQVRQESRQLFRRLESNAETLNGYYGNSPCREIARRRNCRENCEE